MLDDLKFIHQRDGQDALGIAAKQWQQLKHNFEFENRELKIENCVNVVYAGMGGSALAGLIGQSWPAYKLPFELCRGYHAPGYVDERTLFIASSYSGNTEETLSALAEAEEKGAKVVVIAGGGQLVERAKAKSYPHLVMPQIGQPRFAVFYNLRALVAVLAAAGLIEKAQLAELDTAADWLHAASQPWLPTVPKADNPAKQLAEELAGKSIVVYTGPQLAPAAYKWKISFNENAKNLAWWSQYSEWNHNELSGWIGQPALKVYGVIELVSNLEDKRIQKRVEVAERLLSGRRPAPFFVKVEGQTILQQLVWAITFGDFVSLYLALLNGINPSPVDLQERFKQELK